MSEPIADELDYQPALAYDAVVVPRYARPFAELLLRAIELPSRPNILDLACRTGYPAVNLLSGFGEGRVVAIDSDPTFLELTRARGGDEIGRRLFLKQDAVESLPFGNAVFTNVIGNLIDRTTTDRSAVLAEAARVLRPHGQIVLTLPLRGSFSEVLDIFREVALKHDLASVNQRVEQYALSLPTREMWQAEVEAHGFVDAAIDHESFVLGFESAEQLFADPVALTAAAPEWQWCASAIEDPGAVLYRVQEAIDVYFRGRTFELTVIAGCMSARIAPR